MESGTQHNGLPDWRVYARQAEDYERQKRWEDAIPIRIAARDSALHVLGEDDEQVLNLTKELAQLYVQLGHFMEAVPLLHAFLKQRELKGHFESKNVWAVLQQLGQIYIRLKKPKVAVEYLLRAYRLAEKLFEKHDVNVGIISVTLGRSVLSLCRSRGHHEELPVALEAVTTAIDIAARRPEDKFAKSLPKIHILLADLAMCANDRVREGEALVAAIRLLKTSNQDASQLEQRLRRLQQSGDALRRTLGRDEICVSDYSVSEEEPDDDRTINMIDFDEVVSSGVQSDFTARSYSETGSDGSTRAGKSVSCPITPRGRTPQVPSQPSPLSITVTHPHLLDVASSVETTSLPVSPLVTRANERLLNPRSRSNSVSDDHMRGFNNPFAVPPTMHSSCPTPDRNLSHCASPIAMRGPGTMRHRHSDPTLRLRADAYQRSRSCDITVVAPGPALSLSPLDPPSETDQDMPSPRRLQERRGSLTLTLPPLCEADSSTSLLAPLETRIAVLEGRDGALSSCSEADLQSLLILHQEALVATQAALNRLREKAAATPVCSHCHERGVELCLKPCNHACLCRSCCTLARSCPLCATQIESWLAVSFS